MIFRWYRSRKRSGRRCLDLEEVGKGMIVRKVVVMMVVLNQEVQEIARIN